MLLPHQLACWPFVSVRWRRGYRGLRSLRRPDRSMWQARARTHAFSHRPSTAFSWSFDCLSHRPLFHRRQGRVTCLVQGRAGSGGHINLHALQQASLSHLLIFPSAGAAAVKLLRWCAARRLCWCGAAAVWVVAFPARPIPSLRLRLLVLLLLLPPAAGGGCCCPSAGLRIAGRPNARRASRNNSPRPLSRTGC